MASPDWVLEVPHTRFGQGLFLLGFLAMVSGWFLIKRVPAQIRSVFSKNWPCAEGKVETVAVKSFAEQGLGEIGYSYSVHGARYSGYFSQQFADEQDAWNYVNPLKNQAVVVRYQARNPMVSALRLSEQAQLFRGSPGSFPKTWLHLVINSVKNRGV